MTEYICGMATFLFPVIKRTLLNIFIFVFLSNKIWGQEFNYSPLVIQQCNSENKITKYESFFEISTLTKRDSCIFRKVKSEITFKFIEKEGSNYVYDINIEKISSNTNEFLNISKFNFNFTITERGEILSLNNWDRIAQDIKYYTYFPNEMDIIILFKDIIKSLFFINGTSIYLNKPVIYPGSLVDFDNNKIESDIKIELKEIIDNYAIFEINEWPFDFTDFERIPALKVENHCSGALFLTLQDIKHSGKYVYDIERENLVKLETTQYTFYNLSTWKIKRTITKIN